MSLEYTCPQCGRVYRKLSSRLAGKKVQCKCGHTGRAPRLDAPPVQAPPPLPDGDPRNASRPSAHDSKSNSNSPRIGAAKPEIMIQDDFSDLDDLLKDE